MENELIDQLNEKKNPSKLARNLLFTFLIVFFIGTIFKILHWPFSSILITVGTGGIVGHAIGTLHSDRPLLLKIANIGLAIATSLIIYLQGYNLIALAFIIPPALIIYLVLYFHHSKRKKHS